MKVFGMELKKNNLKRKIVRRRQEISNGFI